MSAARIYLLGQPRVLSGDGAREFRLPRKTLNVLGYLVIHRDRPPTRDTLAFALFPDQEEEAARASLRQNLSYLISSLPPAPDASPYVLADAARVAWNADAPAVIDVAEFERALAEERDDDAIAAYGGALLPTLYDEWTTPERERLRDLFHAALTRSIARDRSRRRFVAATAAAHRLLEDDPWREDVTRQLMAIRYEAGDRAGALAAFDAFATALRDEMQAEPMAETVALRDAILSGLHLPTSEPAPRRSSTIPVFALPFVGRDAAMLTAIERWHVAADGRAGVAIVSGEAGIGKSRFVAELARTIESEGGLVVRGETAAGGEHRPYEAFVDALQSASTLRPRHADVWNAVLDELLAEQVHPALADDRSARVRLFDSVRRGMSDLARSRPACIILEDLHWAAQGTIDLLEYVARRADDAPLLIVVTLRTDELSAAHPVRAVIRQLESRANAELIVLSRLMPEVALLAVRESAPPAAADRDLERVVAWADGVPLLLAEAMRDLAAGRPPAMGDLDALVGERFSRLSESAETVLVYGAVLGSRFELSMLAAITGWRDDEIVEALGESVGLGLIRATTRSPGLAFTFSHHLLRTAALSRIPPKDLARAHGLAARALASLPDSEGARAGEIARQFVTAGDLANAARQLRHAAAYALRVFANEEAAAAATSALELLEKSDCDPVLKFDLVALRERALTRLGALAERREDARALVALAGDDVERSCTAWERVFEAHAEHVEIRNDALAHLELLGDKSANAAGVFERSRARQLMVAADYPAARDAAARAAEWFARAGDRRASIEAELEQVAAIGRLADYDNAKRVLERLESPIEGEGDLALLLRYHRVAASALDNRRVDVLLEHARKALELALRIGDRMEEARGHQNLGVHLGKLRDFEGALREHELSHEAYRDVGEPGAAADAVLNLASVRGYCGDMDGAERLLDGLDPQLVRRQPWLAMRRETNRTIFALRSRRLDDALANAQKAIASAHELGARLYETRLGLDLSEIEARMGQSARARARLDRVLVELEELGQPAVQAEAFALSARMRAKSGEAQAARADAAKARGLAQQATVQHFAETAWNLAAAYAMLGDADDARALAEEAARAFADGAMRMPADIVDAYARLPWHRDAFAFLAGRRVPLSLDERFDAEPG